MTNPLDQCTTRQRAILSLLGHEAEPLTPNQIASALGFRNAPSKGGIGGGRGSGAGTGPAQRVIGSLNGLRLRGLIDFGRRPDGLSGTAYAITEKGKAALGDLGGGEGP